jgi:hypothetical protein
MSFRAWSTGWSGTRCERVERRGLARRHKLPPEVQEAVRIRAGHRCEHCHASEQWQYVEFTMEHLIPVAAEGRARSRTSLLLASRATGGSGIVAQGSIPTRVVSTNCSVFASISERPFCLVGRWAGDRGRDVRGPGDREYARAQPREVETHPGGRSGDRTAPHRRRTAALNDEAPLRRWVRRRAVALRPDELAGAGVKSAQRELCAWSIPPARGALTTLGLAAEPAAFAPDRDPPSSATRRRASGPGGRRSLSVS